jgi:hypothetical protein
VTLVREYTAGDRSPLRAEETRFGPHCKNLAINGTLGLCTAFNWDQNLYLLDLNTGKVRAAGRIGHHFAYAPEATGKGFAVQGFDLTTPEGYHLYQLDASGQPLRRFALYGLPKRATSWATGAQMPDAINQFANAPDGSWVASAGDLGLAVWDGQGKLLWSQDWWKTIRKRVTLLAQGARLIVLDGATVTTYDALNGQRLGEIQVAASGTLLGGVISADQRTLALRADCLGGRVFVLRDGKIFGTLPTAANAVALSPDGSIVVVTVGTHFKWYNADGGLVWQFTGDDVLHHPQVSPDGQRACVGSELGRLYILDREGMRSSVDLGSLPALGWMPDGDLIAATWRGTVARFGNDGQQRWGMQLAPTTADIRPDILAADKTPTTRRTDWGNAAEKPAPLTPNLLKETNALITAVCDPPAHGDPRPWQYPIDLLRDGKPEPPPRPWLGWTEINYIDSGWRGKLALQVDTFRTQMRVTGVTFVEDPAHPESWLRDMRLQFWEAATGRWRDGPYLLSNRATHTHWFEKPIEAAKFRFVTTGGGSWPAGNLRLGELVFHGEVLGCSHPDAAAKRPVAVLFDEHEDDLATLKLPNRPFVIRYTDAFSGGKCLALTAEGQTLPNYLPPFGHAVPNWDFEIAENPKFGQYRYLQFAWKSLSPKTTGMSLLLGRAWPGGGYNIVAGKYDWREGTIATKQAAAAPPAEWQTVRVDLWALSKQSVRIQALGLGATGGGAAFDQILLGRTEADLDRVKPAR